MIKKIILLAGLCVPSSLLASEVLSESSSSSWFEKENVGLGLQLGTLGGGGHLTYKMNDWFFLRGEINGLSVDESEEIDGTQYDGGFDFFSVGLTANFRPFYKTKYGKGFRVEAGAYVVDNSINLRASSPGTVIEIGSAGSYTLQDGDNLDGTVDFDGLSPYLGVGWDFNFGKRDQFVFSVDAGVLYVGEPDVSLTPNGTLLTNSGIAQSEFDAEVDSVREDVESARFYPVLKLGLTYRF